MSLEDRKIVVFKIEDEEYATGISQVERILEYQKITRIPDAPEYLKGVINYLGRIVPVIDLKKRFGLFSKGEGSQIIVARKDRGDVGLIVDSVSEVISIDEEMISPSPEVIAGILKKYIKGIIKFDDRLIIYLDLGKILTFDERELINEILESNQEL